MAMLAAVTGITAGQDSMGPPSPRTWIRESPPQLSEYIREVLQDREGNLWFGTNGDGVFRYDGTSLFQLDANAGLSGSAVRGNAPGPAGRDVVRHPGRGQSIRIRLLHNFTVTDGLSDPSVWSLMRDRNGTLWAGTEEGVCRFDGESFVPFPLPRVEVKDPSSRFTPKVVFAMLEDHAGHLWFGTDGGGVSRCDGKTFRNYTKQDGLNNDRVYEILEDQTGVLWFSTLGAGACRFDGTTFEAFGIGQGLTIYELPCPCGSRTRYPSCHGPKGVHVQEMFQDTDGTLWFGCSGGLFRLEDGRFINVTR